MKRQIVEQHSHLSDIEAINEDLHAALLHAKNDIERLEAVARSRSQELEALVSMILNYTMCRIRALSFFIQKTDRQRRILQMQAESTNDAIELREANLQLLRQNERLVWAHFLFTII